jgi:hypothetical protein
LGSVADEEKTHKNYASTQKKIQNQISTKTFPSAQQSKKSALQVVSRI